MYYFQNINFFLFLFYSHLLICAISHKGAISTIVVQRYEVEEEVTKERQFLDLCTSLHFTVGLVATGGLTGVEGGEDGEKKREFK